MRNYERNAVLNMFGYCSVALVAALPLLLGCSTAQNAPVGNGVVTTIPSAAKRTASESVSPMVPSQGLLQASGKITPVSALPKSTGVDYFGDPDTVERLNALWLSRTQAKPLEDFAIGPGDQIVVSVPGVEEFSEVMVRVSATGTITLPFIGQLQAAGLTENELRSEIAQRLHKYIYKPEFQMYVKEYQARFVAVLGAVKNPGVFTLTSTSETVLQLLSSAGGAQDDAGDRVILIPAISSAAPNAALMMAGARMTNGEPADGGPPAIHDQSDIPPLRSFVGSNGPPLVISLTDKSTNDSGRFLNMPLRPGDVIVVPGGGQVSVVGWVYNPGHFPVTSGLSALAAIGQAGGPMWAGDGGDVRLLRTANNGTTQSISLDLNKIKRGEAPDPLVQSNDVIAVSYSNTKILPYILYTLVNNKVGAAVPLP